MSEGAVLACFCFNCIYLTHLKLHFKRQSPPQCSCSSFFILSHILFSLHPPHSLLRLCEWKCLPFTADSYLHDNYPSIIIIQHPDSIPHRDRFDQGDVVYVLVPVHTHLCVGNIFPYLTSCLVVPSCYYTHHTCEFDFLPPHLLRHLSHAFIFNVRCVFSCNFFWLGKPKT